MLAIGPLRVRCTSEENPTVAHLPTVWAGPRAYLGVLEKKMEFFSLPGIETWFIGPLDHTYCMEQSPP
jgi:hypothetical protein